jgi:hypothetical protein
MRHGTPGAMKPGPGWNGKLTWPFGGGAGPGFRSGSNAVTSALQHTLYGGAEGGGRRREGDGGVGS